MNAGKGFHCEYCDVTMTGTATYETHMSGRKHKRKLQALGAIALSKMAAIPTSSTSTNTTVPQNKVSGYAGKFVRPSTEVKMETKEGGTSMYAYGQFGQVQSSTPGIADNTYMQSQAYTQAQAYTQPQAYSQAQAYTQSQTYTQAQTTPVNTDARVVGAGNTDPVMKAIKANIVGSVSKKRKPAYDGRCEICGVDYTSKELENMHLLGKKHKKKLQSRLLDNNAVSSDSTGISTPSTLNPASFYCGFCNLQLNSLLQLEQHRQGTSHLNKVKKCQDIQQEGATAAKRKFIPASETINTPMTSLPHLEPLTYDKIQKSVKDRLTDRQTHRAQTISPLR
ncbi:zinc finger RNA-binding protein-like isoform X2 [Dreissena polymorpha]|nr:zinc finger RNA-binding protein-like isoform X2 [Dreissena polymorpha]XP_052236722.1 zinc finger RNA-binding protein-like isoform X2 [Dreissena polymorpha]